ncbi:XRE family transcriptional regulator [Elstera litoralis]|uniref:XRE family transcriptional regulator n=1 Tax=Elstera litoralis TaxID=552518 RepID=A0A0F3IUK9_9PROT|nr:XRE family transcriptional regulator [Elstera litoralis]KJV10312.1 XRE family transcriptional regulator [Elstera litoralis]
MENYLMDEPSLDQRLAQRLKALRAERGWSLDDLAKRSTVSRATLSRLENAEVSGTATVLGKLCAAYGLPLSRLLRMVEAGFAPVIRPQDQPVWTDPETGFVRRSLSPPAQGLAGEVLECHLPPNTDLAYDAPPRPGLEHHVLMQEGALTLTLEGKPHRLAPGDCLRYQLFGASRFMTPPDQGARYLLFLV